MNSSVNELRDSLSVVMPAFNEEENIQRSIEAFSIYQHQVNRFEMIIVDDGSTDKTAECIRQLAQKHDFVRVLAISIKSHS